MITHTILSLLHYSSSPKGGANLTKADEGGGEAVPERKNKGRIAAKVPARIELKEGKRYLWCACGYSKNQVRVWDVAVGAGVSVEVYFSLG